jgi:hypothetical protein
LTTTRSIVPKSARKERKTSKTCSSSVTSSARTSTRRSGWAEEISAFSASSRSVRRAHSARSCPSVANCRAISAPSPLLAPVIRIVGRNMPVS